MKNIYVITSKQEFEQKLNEIRKTVLIKFTAEGCPPCVGMDKTIEAFEPDYDMDIFVINALDAGDLLQMYGILGFPTCVIIDENSKMLEDFCGFMELDTFKEMCNRHFIK